MTAAAALLALAASAARHDPPSPTMTAAETSAATSTTGRSRARTRARASARRDRTPGRARAGSSHRRRSLVGVLAAPQPAAQPIPAPAAARAPAAAPGTGPRDRVRAVAAVGPVRGLAREQAHPAVAVGLAPVLASGRALAVPRPGALLHPGPDHDPGAPGRDRAAAIVEVGAAVPADHGRARAGGVDLVQAGHVPAHLRRPAEPRPDLGVQPAGHRRHPLQRHVVAAGRLRQPDDSPAPRGGVRSGRLDGRGRRRRLLRRQGRRLDHRHVHRRRHGWPGHAPGQRLGRDAPGRRGDRHPHRRRLHRTGRSARRADRAGRQDRGHRPDGDLPRPVVPAGSAASRRDPSAARAGVRHRPVPAVRRHALHDRQVGRRRGLHAGAAVRSAGDRDRVPGHPARRADAAASGWTRRCCCAWTRSPRSARSRSRRGQPTPAGRASSCAWGSTAWRSSSPGGASHGAQTVLDTCGCKIVTPGVSDDDLLRQLSSLCGQVSYRERRPEAWRSWHDVHDRGDAPAAPTAVRGDHPRRLLAGHRQACPRLAASGVPAARPRRAGSRARAAAAPPGARS